MPCDEVRTTIVNLQVADLDILEGALKSAGYDVNRQGAVLTFSQKGRYDYHRFANGQLQMQGENVEQLANEIRRHYSLELVQRTAARFGWKINKKSEDQFVVQRRR